MQIEVKKTGMSRQIIKAVAEIDKEFYTNFDYSNLSWYYERYSDKNNVFLMLADGKIVGYFLFIEISKSLFDDILKLHYDNDYSFSVKDWNCKSGYFYIPSVLVKEEYRPFSQPLLKRLYIEAQKKDNLVAITVSKEGRKMASKLLKFVGVANAQKDVRVYANRKVDIHTNI